MTPNLWQRSRRPVCKAGFRGRRLRVEQLEIRQVLDGSASLADDAWELHQNGPQVELDVLANDRFAEDYTGDKLITSVSYGSEGGRVQIASHQQGILYTPPADFFGSETFLYAVDGEHTAEVTVRIVSPLEFDRFEIPPNGQQYVLEVLSNDPFWPDYEGPRLISAVSVGSAGGSVEIGPGNQSVIYTPPSEAFGTETFVYIVDDIYPAQVNIEIPQTLEDDRFEILQNSQPQTFHVLVNDPFWTGYAGDRRVTHVTQPEGGIAQISDDGHAVIYTPGEETLGWNSFRYVVDGTYEANVTVVVHRPVQDDAFEVDRNSSVFYYDVTANDTYRDLHHRLHDVIDRVTSVSVPESGGLVTISAGGQGILYTPPTGFSGSDTFTYVADDLYQATVRVQVTRPVRDDYIPRGIYQDTPAGQLNLLDNDFLGNGYDGARRITDVGETTNGGSLAIRGDGRAVLYTPAPGYTGHDQFRYTVDGELDAHVNVYVEPLARSDHFTFCPNLSHGPYTLDVMSNDNFRRGYVGPGIITAANATSEGGNVWITNGRTLRYAPVQAGNHSLRYTVDNQYEAFVSVWIPNHVAPDQEVVDQNAAAQQLHVMVNDFEPDSRHVDCRSQDYRGPRLITEVGLSEHGGQVTIAEDGQSVFYEPPEDFVGSDRFTYTVDDFLTTSVSVAVIRRVRDDQFRVDAADGQQNLPVLVNDLLGANYSGPGRITAVTATSAGGTAELAGHGNSILYTPPAGFVGTDTFRYTVDGALIAQVSVTVDALRDEQFPTFGSLEEYTEFLIDDALVRYEYLFGQTAWTYLDDGVLFDGVERMSPTAGPADRSHSETNVQVAGVDEGDIVEFDSDYVYLLRDNELVIVDAWPAEELSIAARLDIEGRTIAQFLHGDRLTEISETGGYGPYPVLPETGFVDSIAPPRWPRPSFLPFTTMVTVLDVSDRTAPQIVQSTTMEGKYVDSRGVGDYIYVLVDNFDAVGPAPRVIDEDGDPETPGRYETVDEYLSRVRANVGEFVEEALPNYTSYGPDGEVAIAGLLNTPENIYRSLVPDATNLISVVSFDVESSEPGLADTSAVYSTGAGAIYASLENFYVFDQDYVTEDGPVTRITKFDWEPSDGSVEFAATTYVAGNILNQFSADEHGPYLRIATTIGNHYAGNWSGREENTLFVLEEDDGVFEFVGGLQNLALDETMRSVRFMGDTAFVSTLRVIDPLFAIDLSDPTRPTSIGHITLPGFTSYMQAIDDQHLLTVGRNTPTGWGGPTQVSLFNIADLSQPRRVAEYTFARFSTSEAEVDHHAFGFYAEHGLLGMPISRWYVERIDEDGDGYRETRRTVAENKLAVFRIDVAASVPSDRLGLAGQIQHDTRVRRSGYIGDKLFSIANDSVKVVDVANPDAVLQELIIVPLDEEDPIGKEAESAIAGSDSREPVSPAVPTSPSFVSGVHRARNDLAQQLGREVGAPMLITAQAAPKFPGGGYHLVFRVANEHFLYRAGENELVAMVDDDFHFATSVTGAWHSIEVAAVPPPLTVAGDYNGDGQVDEADRAVWKRHYGATSLTTLLAADGNRDGRVDAADYTLWRNNLGASGGAGATTSQPHDSHASQEPTAANATQTPLIRSVEESNRLTDAASVSDDSLGVLSRPFGRRRILQPARVDGSRLPAVNAAAALSENDLLSVAAQQLQEPAKNTGRDLTTLQHHSIDDLRGEREMAVDTVFSKNWGNHRWDLGDVLSATNVAHVILNRASSI